ncbi:helix-turn-helix transcriptional regulator [Bradyrhizobium sp. URHC0002]
MSAIGIKRRLEDRQSMTHAVSRVLRARVIFLNPSLEEIADEFSMQPRTLNRRLQAEGTTFRALTSEARFEVARQLLKGTRMRIADVALALGYANASGFSNAFHRWAGAAPSEWRSHHRDARN